jgi:NTE family protein
MDAKRLLTARRVALFGCLTVALLAGCAAVPPNTRMDQVDVTRGYRLTSRLVRPNNDPETLLLVAFSGGGTRAAALSYGVLETLRQTEVDGPRGRRSMLDEVDAISSVSGGSFTALAYALYGERIFAEYPKRFLYRDVEGALVVRALLNPVNWVRFSMSDLGRSDVAAAYYDEILFEGATFGDLIGKPTPTVIAQTTDISNGARFSFVQSEFDVICSDLSAVKLSHAAAASSAVPLVLSPVTLDNHGGACGFRMPEWMEAEAKPTARAWPGNWVQHRVKELEAFANGKDRPFLHLVDGGLVGNLGLNIILELLRGLEDDPQFEDAVGLRTLRRVAVIVVDAEAAIDRGWDASRKVPGEVGLMLQTIRVPMSRYSYASLNEVEDALIDWSARLSTQPIEFTVVYVSFDAITDPAERAYLLHLPTTLSLPEEAVDRLRVAGGRLLRESPQFQTLMREMGRAH